MVYVTPGRDPNALIPGWDGEKMLPVPFGSPSGSAGSEGDRPRMEKSGVPKAPPTRKSLADEQDRGQALVRNTRTIARTGAPVPTRDRIVVEAFDRS